MSNDNPLSKMLQTAVIILNVPTIKYLLIIHLQLISAFISVLSRENKEKIHNFS